MINSNAFRRRRQAVSTRNWTKDCYFKLYKNQVKVVSNLPIFRGNTSPFLYQVPLSRILLLFIE